jgi:ligand-binding sensor domain-containing protein
MKKVRYIFVVMIFALILSGCRQDPLFPDHTIYPNWNVYNTTNSVLPSNDIWELELDDNNMVWITTNKFKYLTRTNGEDWENIIIPGAAYPAQFWARGLAIDHLNNIWFNLKYDVTLKYSDGEGWTTYDSNETGMFFGHVFTLKHDHIGNLYFATAGGLIKFDGVNWVRFDLSNSGITSSEVISLSIDVDNSVWLSSLGHPVFGGQSGVSHFDGSNWTTYNTNNSELPANAPVIVVQNNGIKWFVSGFAAARFNGSNWNVLSIPHDGPGGVSKMYVDPFDHVWFCTTDNGLIKFDGMQWTTYKTSNSGIPSNWVNDVAVDPEGKVWVATSNGLAVFVE